MKDEKLKELIHRYLDGDLAPEEANALIDGVKADRTAAKELKALERLGELADDLPRPAVSPDFLARTLARIDRTPVRPPSFFERWRARKIELTIPQLAFAAALAVVVMATPYVWRLRAPVPSPAAAGDQGLVTVQFTLAAPDAKQVQLAGDFNGWNPALSTLQRGNDGTYRLQLKLPKGRYQYAFVVDGQRWVPDPLASEVVDDGFGGKNAVIDL